MPNPLSSGVMVPLITPYHFNDVYPLLDYIINGRIDKIILLGTTGEGMHIEHEQKIAFIRAIAQYIGNKAQLIIVINSKNLEDALELMEIANEVGACASMIAPLIISQDIDSVVDTLLSKASGNLLLYNFPLITHNRFIPLDQIESLFSEKRILGIKDSSGDLKYLDHLLEMRKDNGCKVYYGSENNLREAFEKGVDGIVPGTGNIAPELFVKIWSSKDEKLYKELHELKDAIYKKSENYIVGLKTLMHERGLITSPKTYS